MTASLLDIAPLRETVDVLGTPIEVRGISAGDLVSLFLRFPDIQKLFAERDIADMGWRKLARESIAAMIAAAIGKADDPAEEAAANSLPAESQLDLMDAIIRMTAPRGIGPFVEKINRIMVVSQGALPGSGPDTTSPAQLKN